MTEKLGARLIDLEKLESMALELRQLQCRLIREEVAVDPKFDPTGIVKAALIEAGKSCFTTAVHLEAVVALIERETMRAAARADNVKRLLSGGGDAAQAG